MADKGHLVLHYRGGETDDGELGYYAAATAMMAFGDFVGAMSRASFGAGAKVETKVSSVSPTGSMSFEFLVYAAAIGQAALLTPVTASEIWGILKDSIRAWKFLKGKPPESIVKNQDNDNFGLTNINGDVEYFTQNITVLINDPKAGDALEQLIQKPMDQAGITEIEIEDKDLKDVVTVVREDRDCFTDISRDQTVIESTVEKALYIESIKFRDGNKWEFYDGQSRFSASIDDEVFLARINSGEPFSKGDMLIVDLYSEQKYSRGKLVVKHEIKRVKKHINKSEQLDLD